MASEAAIQGILGGLKAAQERRTLKQRGEIEQQRLAQDSEQRRLEREQRADQFQENIKIRNEQLKLQQQAAKVADMTHLQNILSGIESGKPAPPGISRVGGDENQSTLRIQGMPGESMIPGIIGSIPTPYSDVEVDTPAAAARKAAARLLELNKPKIDYEISKQEAVGDREIRKLDTQADNQLNRDKALEGLKLSNKIAELGMTRASQESVARIRANATLGAAAMRAKTGVEIDPDAVARDVEQVHNGNLTLTELRRMYPDKNQYAARIEAMNGSGTIALDDKQKPLLDAFTPAFAALKQYEDWLAIRSKEGWVKSNAGAFGMGTEASQELNRIGNAISENLGTFQSLMIKTGRGVTDKRIQQVKDAYTPDTRNDAKISFEKAKGYRDLLDDLFKSTYGNLSKSQQLVMKKRIYDNVGLPAPTETGGMGQPERIKVRHKQTGKTGTILPQDYNPDVYEEVGP